MGIAAMVVAVLSFTAGVFLWSKYGIKRGHEVKDSFFNEK